MKQVFGWHNYYEELKLMQAQLVQLIAQAQSLSKAISEVLPTEEVANEVEPIDHA